MPDEPQGVVHTVGPLPPIEPGVIASAIKRVTFDALGELPPGTSGALVRVTHDKGVELVVAHKSRDGHWTADLFIGKGWNKIDQLNFGAEARVLW